jgi:hypothetical protein
MKQRIIRKGDGVHWRITTQDFEKTPEEERIKLKGYFDEIHLNYHVIDGDLMIDGSVDWKVVDEVMSHFYDGWAEFAPF